MTFFEAIVLGIVQGLTEFLPVSSSGHLELTKAIVGDSSVPEESLMMTVLLSYFATLGITFLFFWLVDPGFAGLDWKVPMFLFTILIAVGQDYNIFLITRIEEESREAGPIDGIVLALDRTGSIISSCRIIMAGTFSSLMAGSLMAMDQLGFALALGVILDTFVIRPIMVPAFLILLARRRERLAAAQPAAEPAAAAQS